MTPRLRNLLIALGVSVAVMVVDKVSLSSGSSNNSKKASRRVSKTQTPKKVIAESSAKQSTTPKAASITSIPATRRRSSRSSQLVGWQRNPFNSVAVFRQGEYLNNDILIERIENDQITFRNGNTTVTRNVGN